MTETTHPEPIPSPHRGASTNAIVAAAEVRRGEWGSRTLPTLVRDFTRAALRISEHTAWMKADALVHQGKLDVMPGEVGWDGHPRIYSIPATPESASGPSGPAASSAVSTASVVVTFKDEGRGDGPVVVIRVAPTPEVAAAIAAGVSFAYDPSNATDLGWMSRQQASTIAALHSVELAEW